MWGGLSLTPNQIFIIVIVTKSTHDTAAILSCDLGNVAVIWRPEIKITTIRMFHLMWISNKIVCEIGPLWYAVPFLPYNNSTVFTKSRRMPWTVYMY